jgi:hypothetical protein
MPCWSIFQQPVACPGEVIQHVHVSKEFKEKKQSGQWALQK